jgi:hypothetical protein
MATQTATGSGSTNNDTGRVLSGNPSGTRFVDLTNAASATDNHKQGLPTESSTLGNTTGISGRAFSKTRAGQYIIRSFSTKVAGVTDTTFRSPGHPSTAVAPSFAKIETVKTGKLTKSEWDSTAAESMTVNFTQSAKTVAMGTDQAASRTKRLTFQSGSNTPTTTVTSY